ncbi:hypothetical protein ZIOFF_050112 [Zingiber officinale]|uniref:Uncharacterized protein n=1 Tax=Zingiber officinale TaxID=94328 RepID=A0A8J5FKP4_ZINOF|nr:hypothetical protein ZIOFF_050112 [Zingiber officinale]
MLCKVDHRHHLNTNHGERQREQPGHQRRPVVFGRENTGQRWHQGNWIQFYKVHQLNVNRYTLLCFGYVPPSSVVLIYLLRERSYVIVEELCKFGATVQSTPAHAKMRISTSACASGRRRGSG